jgi:hypothetical protein
VKLDEALYELSLERDALQTELQRYHVVVVVVVFQIEFTCFFLNFVVW